MLNVDEFYAVNCILNYAWAKTEYDRYLAFNDGKPLISYEDSKDYPKNIAHYQSEEEALESLKTVLEMEAPNDWSTSDRVNLSLVRNSNKYAIALCKIENNRIVKISESKIAELDRRW